MGLISVFERNRLLLRIAMPVILFGAAISILLPALLLPNVSAIIAERTDALLVNAAQNAIRICDERFNDLLELRMETDREMRRASLKQAIEEIKGIRFGSPDIHLAILSADGQVRGTTFTQPFAQAQNLLDVEDIGFHIQDVALSQDSYRIIHSYFPFWKIHIFTMMSRPAYMAPIILAKRIVYLGTFGVLTTVVLFLILVFYVRVNRPLKTIIGATQTIRKERPDKVVIRGRHDEIGQLAEAFNTMVDQLVEDRVKIHAMMREIRDSEEQYRILSEYSLTHIALIQKGRLLFLNNTLAVSLETDTATLSGTSFEMLIDPRDRQLVMERLAALENGHRKSDRFECRLNVADDEIWLDALATLALFKESNAILFHAVDVTASKTLERKLSQAQKLEAIGTLAGGVAHDLNNILSGLLGYPELLLMDLSEDSKLRKPLIQIQQSAQKAAEIVQDLLTMARRGVDVKEVVNLNLVIQEYLMSLEHTKILESHPGATFALELDENLLNLEGSSVHLSKTVMNLVRNAAESMPDGGQIRIRTRNHYVDGAPNAQRSTEELPEGDYINLQIADDGTGISKEDLEHIFEPFYTKKVMGHSGTGLGMSVVLGTVQDHQGKVEVDSREGHGTQFTLYFPATRATGVDREVPIDMEQVRGNGERLLVVDDVEDQRTLMIDMLGRLGYQVDAVDSGEAALAYIEQQAVDLVILDMIMDPGMDGLETFQEMRRIVPGQKAIILSGFSETRKVEQALEMGAGAYLKKPVILEKLGHTVRSQLNSQ